jgi:hypothetical protein
MNRGGHQGLSSQFLTVPWPGSMRVAIQRWFNSRRKRGDDLAFLVVGRRRVEPLHNIGQPPSTVSDVVGTFVHGDLVHLVRADPKGFAQGESRPGASCGLGG